MDGFAGKKRKNQLNVLGSELELCNCNTDLLNNNKVTGFFRDGFCKTGVQDSGLHTVCSIMTNEFLEYSISVGNDLTTPVLEYGFQGLESGDHWCLCGLRWKQAFLDGKAPLVKLESTNILTLSIIEIEKLKQYASEF